jgi:type I restriction enzyme S subunit
VDKASGSFIARLLGAPQILEQAREVATGTAQLTIPLSGLRAFRVPLPTSTEQEEIVRRVDAAFAWLDKLASEHARAASLLPKLDQAILAKAFRGELVPQDPSDEPASELLERIRATGGQQPHRRRARKPRSDIVPRAPRERAAMTKSRYDDDVRNKPYLADLLRQTTGSGRVEDLFKRADLTVADFYKQLKWEVDSGHIRDDRERLEAA